VRLGESALVSTEDRLTHLYRSYGASIYWRCVRILGDAAAAEDATQETFLRVHRHLERAPDGEEAIRWIWRIATNYCLNELRNGKRRAEPVAELPDAPEPALAAIAALQRGDLGDRDLARRIIARAPEDQRVIVWLHHVDGLEQEEVARTLGISRRTVVNKLAAFTENARKYLGRAA
jgi:RNA polymerase sigma-70 factor, ECF subfamily